MRLRQPQRGRKSTFAQPIVLRDRDLGFEPDFRFAAFVMNMYVDSRLFPRKEVEPVSTFVKNGRAHTVILPRPEDGRVDQAAALGEALRLVGDRMHEDGADSAELGGLQGPEHRVAQEARLGAAAPIRLVHGG